MPMKTATKRIPKIYELFYDKNGDLLQSPKTITFKAQDNYANILLINLEDGIEDNDLVLINFTPKNAVIDYTTHWFYVRPLKKIREYIIETENAPRTFSTYLYEVPRIVLNNYVRDDTVENEITIVKRYGLNNLGVFNNYSDLNNEHQANIEMFNSNGFAYVLNDQTIGSVLHKSGYYQVIEVSNGVYEWTIRENVMNYGLEQKQYEVKTAFTEAGYANVDNVPNVEGTVVEALWRDLTSVIEDIIDLQTFYELQFAPQETNTIALTFDKVTNNYFVVEANVKIDENNNDLLETSSDGLYVKHDDTKQNKLIAGDNIKIDPDTNVISSKDEHLEDEVVRVEQKVDTHIEDLNNPHGVTAEQVDTYGKQVIDDKDANTLQEAKDYTYSQVEIDNKDTAIMNKANSLEDANMFKDVSYNNVNGVLTFTRYDDTTKQIDLPLELLVESGYYDEVANELVLVLANGSEIRIPVDNLLTDLDAHNIRFNGSGTNYLVDKTEVESAVKELDTRVKTNDDNVGLLNDTTAKLAVSNVFTQPQQVPNATLPQHTTNLSQVETMFEMFKRELRGYNLAMPDLEGKEYLGDGVYRLQTTNGVDLTYNVYSGVYTMNGLTINSDDFWIFRNFNMSGVYTIFVEFLIKQPNTLTFVSRDLSNNQFVYYGEYDTNTQENGFKDFFVYLTRNQNVNVEFRMQIEKGDTATPYTVPGQIPQYKIVGEE